MKTSESHVLPCEADVKSDEEAVIACFVTGKALDPDVARRVHQRAQAIRERVFHKHGLVDIGVPAIRELRGDLP